MPPLAAGAVWILPPSLFDLLAARGGGAGAAGAVVTATAPIIGPAV